MFTDLTFALRDSPLQIAFAFLLASGIIGLFSSLAVVGLLHVLKVRSDTIGVKVACVVLALSLGGTAIVAMAGHPGPVKQVVLLDGPQGPRIAVFHESPGGGKSRSSNRIRGHALADGALLYQTPALSGLLRITQLGRRFVWLDAEDGPAAVDLYTGQQGATVKKVVGSAALPGAGEFKLARAGRDGVEALEVLLQDGQPAFITPEGALSRTPPAPGPSAITRMGAEASAGRPHELPGMHRAELLLPICGCADAARCGALVRFSTTAFGAGEKRVAFFDGTQKWTKSWAELAGSDDAEVLAVADSEGGCLWITSHGRGQAVWFKRVTGEIQRRLALP